MPNAEKLSGYALEPYIILEVLVAEFSYFDPDACPESGYGLRIKSSALGCYLNPLLPDEYLYICSRCGFIWTIEQKRFLFNHRGGPTAPGYFNGRPRNLPYKLWSKIV